jgi:hypothetical protein
MNIVKIMSKTKRVMVAAVLLVGLLPNQARAWTGDTWGPMSRAQIKAIADEMIDSTWTPLIDMSIWEYTGSTYQYYAGTTYKGIAYTQSNPQETWQEFIDKIASRSTGNLGNDCSGFLSICWKLPSRKTTASLESGVGTKWISLGDIGSAATAPLLVGDALNSSSVGHAVLFLRFESTGVRTMEQTPHNAQRKTRTFSNLAQYRPIRRLDIMDPPAITQQPQPQNQTVAAGSNATFSVTATGTSLTYQWRLNETNISGATASTYTRINAQPSHAGNYTVVVSNAVGAVTSSNAVLAVQVALMITGQPQSQTVTVGSNATFSVTASGTSVIYQWYFNGTNIIGATGSSWTRTNSQVSHAGGYSVVVSNASGSITSTVATLTVNPPPEPNAPPMLQPIENRTVYAGSTLSFTSVAFDPNPADILTFSLDPGAPATAAIHPATGVFTWTPANADTNSVHYITVRVTDNGSPPMSGAATFTVTVEPALPPNHGPLLFPIANCTVHAGMLVTFTNVAYDPNPGDTLTFRLDPGAPASAEVGADDGVFTWIPRDEDGDTVRSITVRVTDDGYPPLSGSAAFSVTVHPRPALQHVAFSGDTALLKWSAIPGMTYRVEYKENLDDPDWEALDADVSADGPVATAHDHGFGGQRFYRILILESD